MLSLLSVLVSSHLQKITHFLIQGSCLDPTSFLAVTAKFQPKNKQVYYFKYADDLSVAMDGTTDTDIKGALLMNINLLQIGHLPLILKLVCLNV
jgi:hypothetical protein